jgi:peptide/nickel transport system substrate-binding protein
VEMAESVTSLDPSIATEGSAGVSARNEINALLYHRNADGTFSGTAGSGPFRVAEWEPGKRLTLSANDDFPGGRPFVDSVEIRMGRDAKDRLVDLELDNTDLAEIPAEDARRAADRGVRVSASKANQLIALVFISGRPLAEDAHVREEISRTIDRTSIVNFLLQKEGEPAWSLLPQWSSGTAFLFSAAAEPADKNTERSAGNIAKGQQPVMTGSSKFALGYDAGDGLEQTIAERITVNAREGGFAVALTALPSAPAGSRKVDARLVRWEMPSPRPHEALMGFIRQLGPFTGIDAAPLPDSASPEQIYGRERTIVSNHRVVPIAWMPRVYGLGARMRDWNAPPAGENWPLADVWLSGITEAANQK